MKWTTPAFLIFSCLFPYTLHADQGVRLDTVYEDISKAMSSFKQTPAPVDRYSGICIHLEALKDWADENCNTVTESECRPHLARFVSAINLFKDYINLVATKDNAKKKGVGFIVSELSPTLEFKRTPLKIVKTWDRARQNSQLCNFPMSENNSPLQPDPELSESQPRIEEPQPPEQPKPETETVTLQLSEAVELGINPTHQQTLDGFVEISARRFDRLLQAYSSRQMNQIAHSLMKKATDDPAQSPKKPPLGPLKLALQTEKNSGLESPRTYSPVTRFQAWKRKRKILGTIDGLIQRAMTVELHDEKWLADYDRGKFRDVENWRVKIHTDRAEISPKLIKVLNDVGIFIVDYGLKKLDRALENANLPEIEDLLEGSTIIQYL